MEINYQSQDKSITVRLVYLVGHPMRMIKPYGKSYPKTTQCALYYNGSINVGFVVKHEKDKDNQNFANRLATKKVIGNILLKSVRKEIWKLVIEATK